MTIHEYFLFIPKGEKDNDYILISFECKDELNNYLSSNKPIDKSILTTSSEFFSNDENLSFSEFSKKYKEETGVIINKPVFFIKKKNKTFFSIDGPSLTNNLKEKVDNNKAKLFWFSHHFDPSFYYKRDVLKRWGVQEPLFN